MTRASYLDAAGALPHTDELAGVVEALKHTDVALVHLVDLEVGDGAALTGGDELVGIVQGQGLVHGRAQHDRPAVTQHALWGRSVQCLQTRQMFS